MYYSTIFGGRIEQNVHNINTIVRNRRGGVGQENNIDGSPSSDRAHILKETRRACEKENEKKKN